jgi:hypothetical protein
MSGRVGRAAGLPLVVTPRVGLPLVVPPLPPGATMALWPLAAVTEGSEPGLPLYVSAGKWLHPLFDLLELLSSEGPESGSEERATLAAAGELFLRDRVIGRAAAFLILRAGIRRAWADVVSDGAMALFATRGASLGAGELVPAIACRTESFLRDVDDPDIAWALLQQRRDGLAAG